LCEDEGNEDEGEARRGRDSTLQKDVLKYQNFFQTNYNIIYAYLMISPKRIHGKYSVL
jgi:hypothetical protein